MVLQGARRYKDMTELKFPVTELEKNSFQVVVDMALLLLAISLQTDSMSISRRLAIM